MSKVIVVGNDPSIPGRIERGSRASRFRDDAVEVEILTWAEFGNLGKKHPSALVLDVREQGVGMFEAVSRLKSRHPELPLMLQMTSRQMQNNPWSRLLAAPDADCITHQTNKGEVQFRLRRLLEGGRARRSGKPVAKDEDAEWTAQNSRRVELIYKKMNFGLDASELDELARLQEVASCHANRVATVPLDYIKEFEAAANELLARKAPTDPSV